jgi:sugar phosphate isomerase/epimerase
MKPLSRRDILGIAVAATVASAAKLKTVGVQLYTVRSVLPEHPRETLTAIEQIGYREVEVTYDTIPKIWDTLKQTTLKPVSVHLDTALFTHAQGKLPAVLDEVKKRGFQYAVCPYIAPADRGGVDMIRRLADTLNKAGEHCRRARISLCYHNHAFEFAAAEGGTLLDVLMKSADPKLVSLELDIMWAQVAGVDPVSVLQRYGSRVALMHLKDVATGVDKRYDESIPKDAFREVGKGVVNVPAVLKAAAAAKVKHYFVEQDQTPGDPLQSLRESYEYLSKLDF